MDKKLLEEIERIKLISGYSLKSTLTENKNIILSEGGLRDGAVDVGKALFVGAKTDAAAARALANEIHVVPSFLPTLKTLNFTRFGGITRMDGKVLKTSEEIFKALKSGQLTVQNAGKVYREVFRATTDPVLLKAIAKNTVTGSAFIRDYGVLTKAVFIERTMNQMKIGQKQAEALWDANRLLNKASKNVDQGAKIVGQGGKDGGKVVGKDGGQVIGKDGGQVVGKDGGNIHITLNNNNKNISKIKQTQTQAQKIKVLEAEAKQTKMLQDYSETLWKATGQNADELARKYKFKNFEDWGRNDMDGMVRVMESETRSGTGFFGRLFSKGRRWATVWSIVKWGALALGAYWLYKKLFGDDAVNPCDPGSHMVEGKGCIPDVDPDPVDPDPVVTDTTTAEGGGGGGEKYIECDEPYYKGCVGKKGDNTIKKAQDCLGVTPNGFFNQETEDALKNKINKKSFTSSDMSAICASSYGGGSFQI